MTIWELSYSSGCIFGASELAWSSVSSIYSFDWLDVPGLSLISTYSISLPWRSNGSSWLEHFGEFYLSGENCVCSLGQALRPILTSTKILKFSPLSDWIGMNQDSSSLAILCLLVLLVSLTRCHYLVVNRRISGYRLQTVDRRWLADLGADWEILDLVVDKSRPPPCYVEAL